MTTKAQSKDAKATKEKVEVEKKPEPAYINDNNNASDSHTLSRKFKNLNNPLKQRGHYQYNLSYLSEGVGGAVGVVGNQSNVTSALLQDIDISEKRILYQEKQIQDLLDKQQLPLTRHKISQSTHDILTNIGKIQERQPSRSTHHLGIKIPFIDSTTNVGDSGGGWTAKIGSDQDTVKFPPSIFRNPNTPKAYEDLRRIQFIPNVAKELTSYATYFENPSNVTRKFKSNDQTMRPHFYQSSYPQYLNLGYRDMVGTHDKTKFSYLQHPIIKYNRKDKEGKDYNSKTDVHFNKMQIVTNPKYRGIFKTKLEYN